MNLGYLFYCNQWVWDYFDYAKAALKCGAIDYLLKPIAREELNAAIDKAACDIGKYWYLFRKRSAKAR